MAPARGACAAGRSPPVLWASAAPLRPGTAFAEMSLGWSAIRRNETSPASRHKTLGYLDAVLAAEAAARDGHDEALFLTMQGRVACAGIGNVFAVFGRTIVTRHALDDGVLAGIVRAQVLALAPGLGLAPAEGSMTPAMTPAGLAEAEAVFLTNSLRLLAPVRRIGARDYASAGHPVEQALRKALPGDRRGLRDGRGGVRAPPPNPPPQRGEGSDARPRLCVPFAKALRTSAETRQKWRRPGTRPRDLESRA